MVDALAKSLVGAGSAGSLDDRSKFSVYLIYWMLIRPSTDYLAILATAISARFAVSLKICKSVSHVTRPALITVPPDLNLSFGALPPIFCHPSQHSREINRAFQQTPSRVSCSRTGLGRRV